MHEVLDVSPKQRFWVHVAVVMGKLLIFLPT